MTRFRTTATSKLKERLHRHGLDLSRYRHGALLKQLHVDVIADVGANEGQYGELIRRLGYHGRIVSYEPVSAAFAALHERASADPRWTVVQSALGATTGTRLIAVTESSVSSSFFRPTEEVTRIAPTTRVVAEEEVTIARLDDTLPAHLKSDDALLLKIDTQGTELEVLEGGPRMWNEQLRFIWSCHSARSTSMSH